MTTHPPESSFRRARTRRAATFVTGLAVAAGVMFAGGRAADASSPRTDAAHVAEAASEAADALARWELTLHSIDFQVYIERRDDAAAIVADELDVPAAEVLTAWKRASFTEQRAVLSAITQVGTRYRSLGTSPETGFDCSGLTNWSYSQAGHEIPRTSGGQISDARRLADEELFAGALVHYPGHVGLYVGGGLYVHSPYSGSTVEITTLPERSLRFGDLH